MPDFKKSTGFKLPGFSGFKQSPLKQVDQPYTASDSTAAYNYSVGFHNWRSDDQRTSIAGRQKMKRVDRGNPNAKKIWEAVRAETAKKMVGEHPTQIDKHARRKLRKYKSPLRDDLPRTTVIESGDDMGVWKKTHKDPLIQELSRMPENVGLTTRQLKKKAKLMRG